MKYQFLGESLPRKLTGDAKNEDAGSLGFKCKSQAGRRDWRGAVTRKELQSGERGFSEKSIGSAVGATPLALGGSEGDGARGLAPCSVSGRAVTCQVLLGPPRQMEVAVQKDLAGGCW